MFFSFFSPDEIIGKNSLESASCDIIHVPDIYCKPYLLIGFVYKYIVIFIGFVCGIRGHELSPGCLIFVINSIYLWDLYINM